MKKFDSVTLRVIEEKARAYAAFDRSDPFAYARAKAHLLQGLVQYDNDGSLVTYEATANVYSERGSDGKEYIREHYTNVKRP